jgi:hypothetical protein
VQGFKQRGLDDGCERFRERICNQAVRFGLFRCRPNLRKQGILPASLGCRAYEIHNGIHEPPGEVAAERGEHHRPDFPAARGRNAEGACERECHQHTKDDLTHPVDRVKQGFALV